jgi:hypothetical protein
MIDVDILHKLQEYEQLLKEIQTYFYNDVICRVSTTNDHRDFIDKINNVIYNKPTIKF